MGGRYVEGMGLKFISVIVGHLVGHLSTFGPIYMADTSWTHNPNSPNGAIYWQKF